MTSKESISLQLTLKAIDHLATKNSIDGHNEQMANDIADMYNTIYDKVKTYR